MLIDIVGQTLLLTRLIISLSYTSFPTCT